MIWQVQQSRVTHQTNQAGWLCTQLFTFTCTIMSGSVALVDSYMQATSHAAANL